MQLSFLFSSFGFIQVNLKIHFILLFTYNYLFYIKISVNLSARNYHLHFDILGR